MLFKQIPIFILFLTIQQTQQNWFTSTLTAPYKYLKNLLFPNRAKFRLDTLDPMHRAAAEKFLEVKEDGLGIAYTLIYYNLMLNLERECLGAIENLNECELFSKNIQSVILLEIKNGETGYKYPLIEEFFNKIFLVADNSLKGQKRQELALVLEKLSNYFNGPQFENTKTVLTDSYNDSLAKLNEYLNSNTDQQIVSAIEVEQNQDEYLTY